MKYIFLVVIYFLSNLHSVYSSSWSMVVCEDNSVARKCSKYISKLSKKEGATFFVSGSSRRHFSLDYEGSCPTFDEELAKLKNCESCKAAFNSHENRSDCIEMGETQHEYSKEPEDVISNEVAQEEQSEAETERQTEAQSEKQQEAQQEAKIEKQPEAQPEAQTEAQPEAQPKAQPKPITEVQQ